MTSSPSAATREALSAIADPEVRLLTTRFARYLADEDLAYRPIDFLARHAAELAAYARVRPAGTALVRIADLDHAPATDCVLQIVTDDMPFLVDSVTNAIGATGRAIHLVVHPQLVVRRDEAGRLVEILDIDVDDERPAGTIAESWMWIEMERDYDADSAASLDRQIASVLHDVRVAVRDWRAMRSRALIIAEEISAMPPVGVPQEEVDEGVDLLRWLADDNLTFLGYREYELKVVDGEDCLIPVDGSGLGILSMDVDPEAPTGMSKSFASLPPAVRALARQPELLVLSKANSRSTVHRNVYLDYIGVKTFDSAGVVTGERRFLGLYSSSAYTQSILDIPILRMKARHLESALDYVAGSHDAKDLLTFLETYPRDELFQTHDAQLREDRPVGAAPPGAPAHQALPAT